MSLPIPYYPILTVAYTPVGNTSPHKRGPFLVIRFPDLGALFPGVLPRPGLNHHGVPDDDQIR